MPGAPGECPRLVYRCYCREAIQSAYTSQYIAGIAFVVTAFVKIHTISYYHLRVIYCLLAMNTVIGVASNFDRDSRIHYLLGFSGLQDRPKWKMIDFVYMINIAVFSAFSLYIILKRDQNFSSCYKHSRPMVFATWFWFLGLSGLTLFYRKRFRSAAFWLLFFLSIAGFVGFLSWQIWVLTSTFRKKSVAPGEVDESSFTFGQILVLFMVVPLIGDFTAALMGISIHITYQYNIYPIMLTDFIVDLRRIEGRSWKDVLASFLNIFRVLVPYFVHDVIKDIRDASRKITDSAFIKVPVNAVVGFTSRLIPQHCFFFFM